jgi:hypothetical protein
MGVGLINWFDSVVMVSGGAPEEDMVVNYSKGRQSMAY